jgi:hypothetical protein
VLSQPDSAPANSAHINQIVELMHRLMEYQHQEIRHRLGKVASITLINASSLDAAKTSAVREMLGRRGDVGLFIFDADNNIRPRRDC